MNPCTVLLADDHLIVREGLRIMLGMEPDITIVGEASTGREAVEMTGRLKPDVVVMDIAMPILNGLEATRQILHSAPATRVLILSAHADDAYVGRVMALGAAGYLIKQSSCDVLAKAIRNAARGKIVFSPVIARRLNHHSQKAGADGELPPKADAARLSPREMEVLQLIAEGNTNKETACVLAISIKTVEKHRQKIMEKLNIHDTASLTRYAISIGIVESLVQPTTLDGLIGIPPRQPDGG
jgi:DNA-binding NarL/FixJ family response regulator